MPDTKDRRDIIVIGASMGGQEPLRQIVTKLGSDLDAAVFIVRHTAEGYSNRLAVILDNLTSLKVTSAEHCETFSRGRMYVAPAGCHMLLHKKVIHLSDGPRENLCRPAIDPLFRSAASYYSSRVIAVILSGELDDGTVGLAAVKERGGIVMVQDPATAASPSMPQSALDHVDVDFVLAPERIGEALTELVQSGRQSPAVEKQGEEPEEDLDSRAPAGIEALEKQGTQVPVGCPECSGPLWQLEGGVPRFRCHTGHAYAAQSMLHALEKCGERALYGALASLEERVKMLNRLAARDSKGLYQSRLQEAQEYVERLKRLLGKIETRGDEC